MRDYILKIRATCSSMVMVMVIVMVIVIVMVMVMVMAMVCDEVRTDLHLHGYQCR